MNEIIDRPEQLPEKVEDTLKGNMEKEYADAATMLADDGISADDVGITISTSLVLRDTDEQVHLVCGKPDGVFSFVWHSGDSEGCTICNPEEPGTRTEEFDLTDEAECARFEDIMAFQEALHFDDDEDDSMEIVATRCEVLAEQPEGLKEPDIGPQVVALMEDHRGFLEAFEADEAVLRMSFQSPQGKVHVLGILADGELRYEWHAGDLEGCEGPVHEG